uniref:Uncharacterized protein n=1 Tax=Arundo donax TaxID=35708 RepID=A0A0A9FGI3_ARUDO
MRAAISKWPVDPDELASSASSTPSDDDDAEPAAADDDSDAQPMSSSCSPQPISALVASLPRANRT